MGAERKGKYPIVVRPGPDTDPDEWEVSSSESWRAHPGVEVVRVSRASMRALTGSVDRARGRPWRGLSTILFVEGDKEQRVIFLGPDLGPEGTAHEIGHTYLKHRGSSSRKEYIENEIEAWEFARSKRGHLRTSWLDMVTQSALKMPGGTPERVSSLVCDKLASLGYRVDKEARKELTEILKDSEIGK